MLLSSLPLRILTLLNGQMKKTEEDDSGYLGEEIESRLEDMELSAESPVGWYTGEYEEPQYNDEYDDDEYDDTDDDDDDDDDSRSPPPPPQQPSKSSNDKSKKK